MNTKSFGVAGAMFAFLALGAVGCGQGGEKKNPDLAKPVNSAPVAVEEKHEVKSKSPLGPAGKVVELFFKNWEARDFKKMYAQTKNSTVEEKTFIKWMQQSPIHWRDITIALEEPSGENWNVVVSVEITSLECATAACMVNIEHCIKHGQYPTFYLSPQVLGIQEFKQYIQTWKLIKSGETYLIDICGPGKTKAENIMNYVLNAGRLGHLHLPQGIDEKDRQFNFLMALSEWIIRASDDLGIPEDAKGLVEKAAPMFKTAKANLKELEANNAALWAKQDDKE